MADYSVMTIAELQAEFMRLAAIVTAASAEREKIHRIIAGRKASATAAVVVSRLTAEQRDALKAALEAA